MKLSDYVAKEISNHTDHIFMVTGGGAMNLNDSFNNNKNINVVCCHNEQSCSMAAEGYSRVSGKIGAVNVTTGPGGINALNGVFGAWVDSIPMIIISGQVKRETMMDFYNLKGKLRQLGDQEADIISMVKGITKYSKVIMDPKTIKYEIQKAIHLAQNGRPGPCWIDIPGDVQGENVDINELLGYETQEKKINISENYILKILTKLVNSKRPVIYAGSGIWHSKSHEKFIQLINMLEIPVVTAWNSNDLLWNDHDCYAGRPGSVGDRTGNFTVQNSDCLMVLGCRLNIRLISYTWKQFAPDAYKIGIDIDENELNKPTLKYDEKVVLDLKDFFEIALKVLKRQNLKFINDSNWKEQTKKWLNKYPVVLKEYWNITSFVNPYCFIDKLFENLKEDNIIVTSDGTACVTAFQAGIVKKGQRLFHNSGCASMGFELPAAIGAYYGSKNKNIICIAGDGSIMMNLQELQTISGNKLGVKIFLLNNEGYHSIRQTQNSYFNGRLVGCGEESGLYFPKFSKIASAFGFDYKKISNHLEMSSVINEVLDSNEPTICEVFLDKSQEFSPKLSSKKLDDGTFVTPFLDDMAPFLSRDEYNSNKLN